MPQLDSSVIALLAGIFSAITQLLKGLFLSEDAKRWLPLAVAVLSTGVGALLAFYYGRDPVTGTVEGLIAGMTSLGLYASVKAVVPSVVNTEGWLHRK